MAILRSYRVRVRPNRVGEYEAFERAEGVPMVASMPGCVRAGFARVVEAQGPTYVFFSVWRSRDDLERARSTDVWQRVAAKLDAQGLTEGGDVAEHWDVVALQEAAPTATTAGNR